MAEYMAWKRSESGYFGPDDVSTERLQRPFPANATYELIETSYFGFNIPEERINCEIYHWFHPILGVASGGIVIFQGMKSDAMRPDYAEWRNYMPMPQDITDCTYPNGIRIKMLKPQQEFEISFDDPPSNTHLQLRSQAIMPAAVRPVGGHITQAMQSTGTLQLRGREYRINGYFTRDRSWGDPRSEQQLDIPPLGWHVGVFGDDLAFHVTAFESAEENASLARRYSGFDGGRNYLWGYLWREGRLLGVKRCRKRVVRENGMAPVSLQLEIVDETDRSYHIDGVIQARAAFPAFPNCPVIWNQTRWTLDGRTGYGDTQEAMYQMYIHENDSASRTL